LRVLLVVLILLIPKVALANTMAPIFPVISTVGWLAMPVIVILEAYLYYRAAVNNPIKLSLYSNIASACFGLLVASITLPVMLGPAIEPHLFSIYLGACISFVAILFHWWLSSYLEFRFSKWHKLWKNKELPISTFFMANGISYGLIFVLFSVHIVLQLLDYYAKR
jgi:hypothetical protein